MRIAPRNFILAALLALLVGTLVLERSGAGGREVVRLFPELFADRALRIAIEAPVGAEPSRIELVRTDAEARWTVRGQLDYPARQEQVAGLLERLTSLTDLDLLAEDRASHARYRVGDDGVTVRVYGGADVLLAALVQGEATAAGAGGAGLATYVRPVGRDEVIRAARLAPLSTEPLVWLDTQWLRFEPALVREVRVRGAADVPALELVRGEADQWRATDGEAVGSRRVRHLLESCASLFFDAVVAERPEPGQFADPRLEVTLVLSGGEGLGGEWELGTTFGPRAEDAHLAVRADSPWVARFAAGTVDQLLEAVRSVAAEIR